MSTYTDPVVEFDPELEYQTVVMQQQLVTKILGPIAIANCLFLLLEGASFMIAGLIWYKKGKNLSKQNTTSLRFVMLFNLICVGFSFEDMFFLIVSNKRDYAALYSFTTPESLQFLWGAVVALIVQIFFIRRAAYFLKTSKWIIMVLIAGAALSFFGAIFVTIENILTTHTIGPENLLLVANQLWLWPTAVTDVLISATLSWKLASLKSGFRVETDHTIDRLVRITIGSSAPSAICASVGAIIYITTFSNWLYDLYYVVIIPLPALYTISFLYAISGFHSDSSTGSGSNSKYRSNSVPLTNTSFKRSTSRRPEFNVNVNTITITDEGTEARDAPGMSVSFQQEDKYDEEGTR